MQLDEELKQELLNLIKEGKDILVVEIKSDEDVTEENKAKLKYATLHFKIQKQSGN